MEEGKSPFLSNYVELGHWSFPALGLGLLPGALVGLRLELHDWFPEALACGGQSMEPLGLHYHMS